MVFKKVSTLRFKIKKGIELLPAFSKFILFSLESIQDSLFEPVGDSL